MLKRYTVADVKRLNLKTCKCGQKLRDNGKCDRCIPLNPQDALRSIVSEFSIENG